MMRRAGTPPEHTTKSMSKSYSLASKSYSSASCLEGQISVDLIAGATRPRSGFRLPREPQLELKKG
jgi:hypothetical protein